MKVWRLKGVSNSYVTDEGFVIDAGVDPSHILKIAYDEGISIKGVILTHAHVDHIRYLKRIKEVFGCEVAVPYQEVQVVEGRKRLKENIIPSLARTFIKSQSITVDHAIVEGEFKGFTAIHLPGHTPGSTAYLKEGVLFSGDALVERKGEPSLSPAVFTSDLKQAKESLMKLSDLRVEVVYPGHGNPIEGKKLAEFLASVREERETS